MRARILTLAALALVVSCKHAHRGRPGAWTGIGAFTSHAKLMTARVSPKGTYVAVLAEENGLRSLIFQKLATHETTFVLQPDGDSTIGAFDWANDERVVIQMVDQEGDLAAPVTRGEIYAVNADGDAAQMVFGYRVSSTQTSSHIHRGEPERAWGFVVSTLRNDPRHVLIEQTLWSGVGDQRSELYKLDVYNGTKQRIGLSPIAGASFLTDENGELRIASGLDEQANRRFFWFEGPGWRELQTIRGFTARSTPVGFVARDRTVYVSEPDASGFALYVVSLDTGKRELVAQDDTVPPSSFVHDHATGSLVAVEFEPDLPRYAFLDGTHPVCKMLQGMLAAFPDDNVELINATDDDGKALVRVYSDRDPGQYLLVDSESMSAETIGSVRPWIKPEQMAETSAFHIPASDGFRIHGYVTVPPHAPAGAALPMVVVPHGGPHGVRDYWGFDPQVQLLASEGFAVLQVNYRGSGGYGTDYQEAGYRKWGSRVVEDIIDATRFAVRKGYADPGRICIYGASFGGYAAMQATILAPDLFRCAVGYAGIYDLTRLASTGDIALRRSGRGYVRTVAGDDDAALQEQSPVRHADQIRAKVMLIHGKRDERAPIQQAEALRDALTARGRPPEWIVEPREAHGFYDEGAREQMYTRLVRFLKENTGPQAVTGASAPAR